MMLELFFDGAVKEIVGTCASVVLDKFKLTPAKYCVTVEIVLTNRFLRHFENLI